MSPLPRRRRFLRLPLLRVPDPVLDEDELSEVAYVLDEHIAGCARQMDDGPVSESVIVSRLRSESAREKIGQVLNR